MTHDELLASIERMTNHDAIFMKDALRAVVELHEPVLRQGIEMVCDDCGEQNYNSAYPCLTIQEIEKAIE
jgi:hypothetical protein